MLYPISIRVYRQGTHLGSINWSNGEILVMGRQESPDETLFDVHLNSGGDSDRVAFVPNNASRYSRKHLQLSRNDDASVKILNRSKEKINVGARWLHGEESQDLVLPTEIDVGEYRLVVERSLNSLPRPTTFHRNFDEHESGLLKPQVVNREHNSFEELLSQIAIANSNLLQANSREDLYSNAVEAVEKLLQMDGVAIFDAENFDNQFSHQVVQPSYTALDEIRESKQVRWTPVEKNIDTAESRMGLDCFIGGPIVDPGNNVTAILYAHRNLMPADFVSPRRPLNATLAQVFELIACSVAWALNRIQNQAVKSRFEQFFSKNLVNKLVVSDHILKPCIRDISVMFCDIRRFSLISQNLEPDKVSAWMQDVMTSLSECVLEHDGVVVDFIGDELMAMWGAPDEMSDHAVRACECANSMLSKMDAISQKWKSEIDDETKFGIGINSGLAKIGNTGSNNRFKYGPLGNTVNCASRVQGLTKYLKVDAIITGETRTALDRGFMLRRLGKAKVVNIDDTLDLYQLLPDDGGRQDFDGFESALAELENGNIEQAAEILRLLNFDAPDHPSLLLLNEVVTRVLENHRSGDFTWDFKGK